MKSQSLDEFIRHVAALLDDPEANRHYVRLLRISVAEIQRLSLTSIPAIKTEIMTVDTNNIVSLPANAIKPIQAAKYVDVSGTGVVYPLGQKTAGFELAMKPTEGFECSPESLENVNVRFSYQGFHGTNLELPYCDYWYGNYYGYRPERVFGLWSFDEEWGRMIFEDGHISPNDQVIVKYSVFDDEAKQIPLDLTPMLQYKVMSEFFLAANPAKSKYYFNLFRMERRRWKRNKLSSFSYDDYILAFNRGYNDGIK
jgi:hypothetical protein